jgi:hypothetical protein
VAAVAALNQALSKDEVSLAEIAKALKLDRGAASRRVTDAVARGYLVNAEPRKGKPARISLGDPMPAEIEILPHPDTLRDRCGVAALTAGDDSPSPHPIDENNPADIPAFADEVIE